jgi:hypothetical protein
LEGLAMEDVDIFCTILSILRPTTVLLWPFGTFIGHLVYFSRLVGSTEKNLATLRDSNFRDSFHRQKSFLTLTYISLTPGLPHFSWHMIPKPDKMYQRNTKCTKWS